MAQTNIMDVEVKQLTKYGFQDGKGEYVGYSKKFDEAAKAQIVPGRKFSVEMYIADSGKQYINKVLRQLDGPTLNDLKQAVVKVKEKELNPTIAVFPSTKTETMSKAEWSAKDRSQLIGGLSHDAATLAAVLVPMLPDQNADSALDIYKELLEGMLKIRDEVR